MQDLQEDLEIIKEIYELDPKGPFFSDIYKDFKLYDLWKKKISHLKQKVVESQNIPFYLKSSMVSRLNDYLNSVEKYEEKTKVGNTQSLLKVFLAGMIGFGTGWYLHGKYKEIEEEKERRIADMVVRFLNYE